MNTLKTNISFANRIFKNLGGLTLVKNNIKGKEIFVKTTGILETGEIFSQDRKRWRKNYG